MRAASGVGAMRERNEAILADLIASRAEQRPDLDVLTFERWSLGDGRPDEVRTYADLQENANRIAAALVRHHLEPGGALRCPGGQIDKHAL